MAMQDFAHLNQFGSLIEDFERVERGEVPIQGVQPLYVKNAYRIFRESLLGAQRFIGPDLGFKVLGEDGEFEEKHLDLTRLPFESIAVLYEQEMITRAGERSSVPVVTLYRGGPDAMRSVHCTSAIRHRDGQIAGSRISWTLWPTAVVLDPDFGRTSDDLGRIRTSAFLEPDSNPCSEEQDFLLDRVGQVLVDLCCALACRNVIAREVEISEKIAARRANAGKKPLFSYKVLEINVDRTESSGGAGIAGRSSPRTHLRRGHIRRLASGDLVWVNSAVVKGRTPGIVVKDYRV